MDVVKQLKLARGGGGRSPRRGRGSGRGRGRGRGRGNDTISRAIEVIDLDDGDDICNMALANVELENNPLMKSFEELNAATTLDGYDEMSSGGIWIYPINRAVRDYQFDMVKTALFNNTLVSLPTGLGKTFISAVVMYNFARWYPTGIIVFMAPTRPLVAQQLDACHNTVGIEKSRTVELTGHIPAKKRENLWKTKTVFFLTPQVMLSDIERNFFRLENVRCIVVDEAHKALGNHAYVQVISKIAEKNKQFRVLALTATPGSDLAAVQQVFKNLLISRVELRSENSADILPYTHDKKIDVHVVRMSGYVKEVYDQIVEIFQVYSGKLMKANALAGRGSTSYSKFQLLKARESFRANLGQKMPNFQKSFIEIDYNVCISLAHAIEILNSHGLRTFCIYLLSVFNKDVKKGSAAVKSELRKNEALQNLMKELQEKLNISVANSTFDFDMSTSGLYSTADCPNTSISFNRSLARNDDIDYTLSHPKLKILKDIIQQHFLEFRTRNDTTKAIIFSQYRDSVQEIGNMLNSLRPMVKPMIFIGKANTGTLGQGLKQKDQIQIVERFREGGFNVLVATCVGEEGLDIGEVDLIVCFDASKSPTRLIQRMGRTGRQRDGRTVFLLTSGKEERSYHTSVNQHSNISKTILDPGQLEPFLYKKSPRMIPAGVELSCFKMEINLPSEQMDISNASTLDTQASKRNEKETKSKPKSGAGKPRKKTKAEAAVKDKSSTESTIAKMFERIKAEPPTKKKKVEVEVEEILTPDFLEPARAPPRFISPPPQDDDVYIIEDDLHMFAVRQQDPFSNSSVINKIFDMGTKERNDWNPCTTFYKKKMPSTAPVSFGLTTSELSDYLLDFKALSEVEASVKIRKSFSFVDKDFCACGNTVEAEAEETVTCTNIKTYTSRNSSTNASPSFIARPVTHHSPFDSGSSTDFSEPIVLPVQQTHLSTTKLDPPEKNSPSLRFLHSEGTNNPANSRVSLDTSRKPKVNFTFKKKEPDNQPDDSEIHRDPSRPCTLLDASSVLNLCPIPLSNSKSRILVTTPTSTSMLRKRRSPSPPNNPRSSIQAKSPTRTFIFRRNRSPTPPYDATFDQVPLHSSPKQNCSSARLSFSSKQTHLSPPRANFSFDLNSSLTESPPRKSSFEENLSPCLNLKTPPRDLTEEDSISEFSESPEAQVCANPYAQQFLTLKASKEKELPKQQVTTYSSKELSRRHGKTSSSKDSPMARKTTNFIMKPPEEPETTYSSKSLSRNRNSTYSNKVLPRRLEETYFNEESPSKLETTQFSMEPPVQRKTTNFSMGPPKKQEKRFVEPFVEQTKKLFSNQPPREQEKTKFKFKRQKSNPFIESQAVVSDHENESAGSHSDEEQFEFEDLDKYDESFVDEEDIGVTESQQVMYMKSVKDAAPRRFGRIEKPLSPKYYGTAMDTSDDQYDKDDSYFQDGDEVEYAEVGVYTHAMNQAKIDLASGSGSSGTRYQTRRAKQKETASSGTSNGSTSQTKQRRRIIQIDSSSEEDH